MTLKGVIIVIWYANKLFIDEEYEHIIDIESIQAFDTNNVSLIASRDFFIRNKLEASYYFMSKLNR